MYINLVTHNIYLIYIAYRQGENLVSHFNRKKTQNVKYDINAFVYLPSLVIFMGTKFSKTIVCYPSSFI